MDLDEYCAAIERELAEALEAIVREVGGDTSHAYSWVAGDPKKYERAYRLALQVFRLHAMASTHHPPLSTVESAAAIVAAHLGHIPAQGTDEWRHWHVTFPVLADKERVITEAQKRRGHCYVFVARLIRDGRSWDDAARDAQAHFKRSYSWVNACYHDTELQAKYEPALERESALAETSKNRDAKK